MIYSFLPFPSEKNTKKMLLDLNLWLCGQRNNSVKVWDYQNPGVLLHMEGWTIVQEVQLLQYGCLCYLDKPHKIKLW